MPSNILKVFWLAAIASASPLSVSLQQRDDDGSNRAAYFLDNNPLNPKGNSIVSLKIGEDGLLSSPVRTYTGGKGLFGLNSNGNAGPDSLFSQDAVVVEQNV